MKVSKQLVKSISDFLEKFVFNTKQNFVMSIL